MQGTGIYTLLCHSSVYRNQVSLHSSTHAKHLVFQVLSMIYSSAFILLSPYGTSGVGLTFSIYPAHIQLPTFAVEKKINFLAVCDFHIPVKYFLCQPGIHFEIDFIVLHSLLRVS